MATILLFQVKNDLSCPLSFTNLHASGDNRNPLNPGVTVTPGSGGNGCEIPDCTGQQWWFSQRMIISGGTLYLNLWKENDTAYYFVGNTATFPSNGKVSLGKPSNTQQLTIGAQGSGFTVALAALPK